ncbi:hypothetical protein [Pelagerythrobacter marensis]
MDGDLIVIFVFVIALTALVLGVGNEMYQRHLRHKERQMDLMADKTAEKAAQYAAQVEKLEQRMRVLERIATDRGADLAMEIEDLRSVESREKLQ